MAGPRRIIRVLAAVALVATAVVADRGVAVAGGSRGVTALPEGFDAIVFDAMTKRVFISSERSNVLTVLDGTGAVQRTITVPGAGALLLNGSRLYVASTTGNRIDAFDTTTLALVRSYGPLVGPSVLAMAGGRLWTTTGGCRAMPQLVSIDTTTGESTTHPLFDQRPPILFYCPQLYPSPADPNVLLGFDDGISPPTLVRLDVSAGVPVVTATLQLTGATRDGAMLPDGKTFAVATTNKGIETFSIDSLQSTGAYPAGGTAVEVTSANGGLLAVGGASTTGLDLQVFRIDDPSTAFFARDLGYGEDFYDRGLAFSPDGTRLYVVAGDHFRRTPRLHVFDLSDHRGRFAAVTPARILDTRTANGKVNRAVRPGETIDLQVTGRGGVPTERVGAVALNVTVTEPTAGGHLTVFPTGERRPATSNLNFSPGKTVPNLVVAEIGTEGKVSVHNSAGTTHVIFDVTGWYSTAVPDGGGRLVPLIPSRLIDTRDGTGGGARLGPGASLDVQVSGRAGIPDTGAAAAILNLVATNTTADSFLTVHPSGELRPLTSTVNFKPGETVANRTMVKLGHGGRVTVYNHSGSADVVVDIGGVYTDASVVWTGGIYTTLPAQRLLDTRDGTGSVAGRVAAGSAIEVRPTSVLSVPAANTWAVVLNVTVVDPVGGGFLTVWPAGSERPLASDINFAPGETRPNLVVVPLGQYTAIKMYSSATIHLVADVVGWTSLPQ